MLRIVVSALLVAGLSPLMPLLAARQAYAGTVSSISGSSDGSNLTLVIPVTKIDNEWYDQTSISVEYASGDAATLLVLPVLHGETATVQYNWRDVGSASLKKESDTAGTVTANIPLSTFSEPRFTLRSGSASITSSELGVDSADNSTQGSSDSGGNESASGDIPVIDGADVTEGEPTAYEGIVIDGGFSDWAPVAKYEANDANGELEQVALVWDGDIVFLYLEETPGTLGAYHAGTHGNGKYEIITDLGQRLVFQLNSDGTVSGAEGAESQHVGNRWEISIPASDLPNYSKTISFGMYQSDPMISDVANLDGSDGGGSFSGIAYDGLYGDWDYYPHHIIEYATAGTQENVEDASGALYAEDGVLYGHVHTTMQQHLDNANGHEFTSGVTIRFNDDTALDFYPMTTTVDADGAISWSPVREGLENGTYEFYIMSTDAWHTSSNVDDLNPHDTVFGKMYVTIADDKDQCEFYLDLDAIADKLGVDANDFRVIAAQFINIGDEWITTAGTSTFPYLGIGLGVVTVAGVLGWRELRKGHGGRPTKLDENEA